MKNILVYLPDMYADWEIGFILPALIEEGAQITTMAEKKDFVRSMGGLKVVPDEVVSKEILSQKWDLVILVGSDTWTDPKKNVEILKLIPDAYKKGQMVGAICGASQAIAQTGMMDHVKHTSNYLPFLKKYSPAYKGDALFQKDKLAVRDGNLITAAGLGPIEFGYEILKALGIYDEAKAMSWYKMYKNAEIPKEWN